MPYAPLLSTADYYRSGDTAHDDASRRAADRSILTRYPLNFE